MPPADNNALARPISASLNGFRENQHRIARAPARGRALAANDEMPPGVGFAHLAQRFHGQRNQPQRFPRRLQAPARHRHHSVAGEVRQVIAKGVGGIKIVLGKREGSGRGGRPGIHQRGLQHLVRVAAAAHEAAPVLHENVDVRAQVETRLSPGKRWRMIVVAMMGLISTPVMSWLPEASARATSQPPPGPMIRVLAPGRTA